MSKPLHHIKYSFEDIERYLQGKLSPAEMHALEKAALQDPFLAEAIEGYESADLSTVESDLADIHSRLREEKEALKVVPFRIRFSVWKIAAMLILMAGAGTVGWYLLQEKPNAGIASQKMVTAELQKDALAEKNQTPGTTVVLKKKLNPVTTTVSDAENKSATAIASSREKMDAAEGSLRDKGLIVSSQTRQTGLLSKPMDTLVFDSEKANKELAANILAGRMAGVSVMRNKRHGFPEVRLDYSVKDSSAPRSKGYTATADVSAKTGKIIYAEVQPAAISLSLSGQLSSITPTAVNAKPGNLTATGNVTANVVLEESTAHLSEVVITASPRAQTKRSVSGAVASSGNVVSGGNRDFKTFNGAKEKMEPALVSPSGGWDGFKQSLRDAFRKSKKEGPVQFGNIEVSIEFNRKGKVRKVAVLKTFDSTINPFVIDAVEKHPSWNLPAEVRESLKPVVLTIRL